MAKGDWHDVAAHPLSSAEGSPRITAEVESLSEVMALTREGWKIAPDAPVWAFLPAVWPDDYRTWVHDRATRYAIAYTARANDEVTHTRVALSDNDIEDLERDLSELAKLAGFPDRPTGRIWLLLPIGGYGPEEVCALAQRRVPPDRFTASPELASATRAVLEDVQAEEGGSNVKGQ